MNLLRRYHGGASLPTSSENVSYTARQRMFHDEKRRIAALVATHIPDQASLFINLGTTTEEVARAQPAPRPARDHQQSERRQHDGRLSRLRSARHGRHRATVGQGHRRRTGDRLHPSVQGRLRDHRHLEHRNRRHLARFRHPRSARRRSRSSSTRAPYFWPPTSSKFGRPALVRQGHLEPDRTHFSPTPAARRHGRNAQYGQLRRSVSPSRRPHDAGAGRRPCVQRRAKLQVKSWSRPAAANRLCGASGCQRENLQGPVWCLTCRLTTLQFPAFVALSRAAGAAKAVVSPASPPDFFCGPPHLAPTIRCRSPSRLSAFARHGEHDAESARIRHVVARQGRSQSSRHGARRTRRPPRTPARATGTTRLGL